MCGVVVARTTDELNELAKPGDQPEPSALPDTDPDIELPTELASSRSDHGLPIPPGYEVQELVAQGPLAAASTRRFTRNSIAWSP